MNPVTDTVTTNTDAVTLAATLNELHERAVLNSQRLEVNGREVWSKYGTEGARSWANGSVSLNVRGRSKGAQGNVWLKRGASVSVTVTAA